MDDDGNFLLAGTNGSLNWNGSDTLSIQGTVDATDGEIKVSTFRYGTNISKFWYCN